MSATILSKEVQNQSGGIRVETIRDVESFLCLRTEWNNLVAAVPVEHPFLLHEWVRNWWECFGTDKMSLHIVVVREGKSVVGIAPMLEDTERFYGFKLRKLTFIWNAHVPRCDFIVAGHRHDIYRAIWNHIASEDRRWDLLLLPQLAEDSPTLSWFRELASSSGFLVGFWTSDSSPYVPITGTWEEYLEGLPAKHRSNLRNRTSRLMRLGPLELESLTPDADARSALAEGLRIEAAAWKGQAGTALLSDPHVTDFYSRLAEMPGIRGAVRLHFLRSCRNRIAFDFSLCHNNGMYLIKSGYLPDYATYSPYNIQASLILESCFRAGFRRYDFLGKDEHWKTRWCRHSVSHQWMFIYPNNPRTALFHAMKFRLAPMVKEFGHAHGLHVPKRVGT